MKFGRGCVAHHCDSEISDPDIVQALAELGARNEQKTDRNDDGETIKPKSKDDI